MALRLREASSSDYPPERNTIPGMDGTTLREKARQVRYAISEGEALVG
jgi:hypothetical protein